MKRECVFARMVFVFSDETLKRIHQNHCSILIHFFLFGIMSHATVFGEQNFGNNYIVPFCIQRKGFFLLFSRHVFLFPLPSISFFFFFPFSLFCSSFLFLFLSSCSLLFLLFPPATSQSSFKNIFCLSQGEEDEERRKLKWIKG